MLLVLRAARRRLRSATSHRTGLYIRLMTANVWKLDASDGQLLVKTGVTGRAAKLGHRLTIVMNSWQATVQWAGAEPTGVDLTVGVDSLEVLRGEGGAKGLSGPEKKLAR